MQVRPLVFVYFSDQQEAAALIEVAKLRGYWGVGEVDGGLAHARVIELHAAAAVVNLSHARSHVREFVGVMANGPATRQVPLIFVGGSQADIAALGAEVPAAGFVDSPEAFDQALLVLQDMPRKPPGRRAALTTSLPIVQLPDNDPAGD